MRIFSAPRYIHLAVVVWVTAGLALYIYSAQAQTRNTTPVVCQDKCTSQDGLYEATLSGGSYVIKQKSSGKTTLTTKDKYKGTNDVKAGAFIFDKNVLTFRALYHFGHKGPCTWAGTWNVATGDLIGTAEKVGWHRDATEVYPPGVTCTE